MIVPIRYCIRDGKPKIKPISDAFKIINHALKLGLMFSPRRMFFPMFCVYFPAAVLRGLRDRVFQNHFGQLTAILFFVSIQILLLGLAGVLISRKS